MERGEVDAATEHFQAAAAIAPSDPTSLFKIAMYEQQRKNFPQALDRYNTLLRVTQNSAMQATVLTNMGYVYRSLGDLERAAASWRMEWMRLRASLRHSAYIWWSCCADMEAASWR